MFFLFLTKKSSKPSKIFNKTSYMQQLFLHSVTFRIKKGNGPKAKIGRSLFERLYKKSYFKACEGYKTAVYLR